MSGRRDYEVEPHRPGDFRDLGHSVAQRSGPGASLGPVPPPRLEAGPDRSLPKRSFEENVDRFGQEVYDRLRKDDEPGRGGRTDLQNWVQNFAHPAYVAESAKEGAAQVGKGVAGSGARFLHNLAGHGGPAPQPFGGASIVDDAFAALNLRKWLGYGPGNYLLGSEGGLFRPSPENRGGLASIAAPLGLKKVFQGKRGMPFHRPWRRDFNRQQKGILARDKEKGIETYPEPIRGYWDDPAPKWESTGWKGPKWLKNAPLRSYYDEAAVGALGALSKVKGAAGGDQGAPAGMEQIEGLAQEGRPVDLDNLLRQNPQLSIRP